MSRLPQSPDLSWAEDGTPQALAFDDVYFSRRGGLAESEAVFLAGCGLPERWRGRARFSIAELGFGSGLNVLAAWRAWKIARDPHAILHIVSVEAYPLAAQDAARALSAFPEVADLARQLLARWPARAFGPQRIWFPEDGFALTVWVGDAESALAGLADFESAPQFDAWFLDGFAPSRNPGMWTPALFARIRALSAPDARAATFSVAGAVRRGLDAAGFEVSKHPGFGDKRERLEARLAAAPVEPNPSLYPYASGDAPKRVAVIGAGIAGAACARALERRGVEAIVLDTGRGEGASRNPAGLVSPRLDRGGGPASEFFLAAYLHAVAAYAELDAFTPCGLEEIAHEEDRDAFADLIADPPLDADWMIGADAGRIVHHKAGLVRPSAVIEAWLARVERRSVSAARVQRGEGGWIVYDADGNPAIEADAVVLACGAGLLRFEQASFLPIALSRGQIEWGGIEGEAPARILSRGTYLAPFEGGALFGATFDRVDSDAAPVADGASRARNVQSLFTLAPDIAARVRIDTLRSRAALRATTPDRLPIAGLLPDADAWRAQNAGIAQGRAPDPRLKAPAHDGLYVLGGLGSRGLTSAPLLAERLVSEMCGEPSLLSRAALDALHPARFLHRALKRRG